MRLIKFRAWGIDGLSDMQMWDWEQIKYEFDMWLDDSKSTVMQFTGLLDKNGVEIYEGDLIVFHLDYFTDPADIGGRQHIVENKYCQVKWEQESCSWILSNGGRLISRNDYEIAGNIYENPELSKSNYYATRRR